MVKKQPQAIQLARVTPRRPPRRPAKTDRGAAVANKVIKAATALLINKPSREFSVVEIGRRARVARASLLLQFPGGMPDIIDAVANLEPDHLTEIEDALCRAAPPKTPMDVVEITVTALIQRVQETGHLYRNLLAECYQTPSGQVGEVNAGLGFYGMALIVRSVADHPVDETVLDTGTMALAEVAGRAIWSAAVGTLASDPSDAMRGTAAAGATVAMMIARAVVPVLRERTLQNKPLTA